MFAQFGAIVTAVRPVANELCRYTIRPLATAVYFGVGLPGCMPATVPLAGADPADPSVRVAGVNAGTNRIG